MITYALSFRKTNGELAHPVRDKRAGLDITERRYGAAPMGTPLPSLHHTGSDEALTQPRNKCGILALVTFTTPGRIFFALNRVKSPTREAAAILSRAQGKEGKPAADLLDLSQPRPAARSVLRPGVPRFPRRPWQRTPGNTRG